MSLVAIERRDDVCVVRLGRPAKLNAVSVELETDLLDAFGSAMVAGSRAVVLAGSGRAFSAGADVGEVGAMDPDAVLAYYRASGRVYEAFAAVPQPTVCAVHGYCLGAGFELALGCGATLVRIGTALFGARAAATG